MHIRHFGRYREKVGRKLTKTELPPDVTIENTWNEAVKILEGVHACVWEANPWLEEEVLPVVRGRSRMLKECIGEPWRAQE